MHKWRGFIINTSFEFTCMISCTLIMRQCQGGFYLQVTITFVEKYKKSLTPGPVPKYWIIFSYIRSEDYESDLNFDEK